MKKWQSALHALPNITADHIDFTSDAVSITSGVDHELKGQIKDKEFAVEMAKLDKRIENLACHAFNVYTGCRERINQIRLNEVKRERDNANRLLELVGSPLNLLTLGIMIIFGAGTYLLTGFLIQRSLILEAMSLMASVFKGRSRMAFNNN